MPPKQGKWVPPSARFRGGGGFGRMGGFRSTNAPGTSPISHGFTMRDEARNTTSHQSDWSGTDAKLRQKPVDFVSAGVIEPLKDFSVPDRSSLPSSESPDPGKRECTAETDGTDAPIATLSPDVTVQAVPVLGEQHVSIDRKFSAHDANEDIEVNIDGPEDQSKDQPNELFFFDLAGDQSMHAATPQRPPKVPTPRSSAGASDSSEEVILFRGRSMAPDRTSPEKIAAKSREVPHVVRRFQASSDIHASPTRPTPKGLESRRSASRTSKLRRDTDDANDLDDEILADYIANVVEYGEDDFISGHAALVGTRRDLGGDDLALNMGSADPADLPLVEDFPDPMASKSDRLGISDAEENNSSGIEDNDVEEMEADVDDETLAQLLSKQEELGLGGEDLVIFSGSYTKAAQYNSAGPSAVLQAFDDLDLDDFDQPPSRATRGRRRKQPPNFGVSDSEIEAALKDAWQRDRERKKNRKAERETLRAKGQLGSSGNPNDLRTKYPAGMKLDDMKSEMHVFLAGTAESLQFPPLDKHARKVLHDFANKLQVKSQSTGSGDQRRPVLYRTKRTPVYKSKEAAERDVDYAAAGIYRKYFHRVDIKGATSWREPRESSGARSGGKALRYRDGEVVGASVPELGEQNRGRAMLEKMGWSKGTALGALDNKGILEPVKQVIKSTKAGLG